MNRTERCRRAQYILTTRQKLSQPLPPDPGRLNRNRARWAAIVLDRFQCQTRVDIEDAVCNLLADLMHWGDRCGQDFHEELRRALNPYTAETDGASETAELQSNMP